MVPKESLSSNRFFLLHGPGLKNHIKNRTKNHLSSSGLRTAYTCPIMPLLGAFYLAGHSLYFEYEIMFIWVQCLLCSGFPRTRLRSCSRLSPPTRTGSLRSESAVNSSSAWATGSHKAQRSARQRRLWLGILAHERFLCLEWSRE